MADCECGRSWRSASQCHCVAANCHRHFSSEASFAKHQSAQGCHDPLTLRRLCGCAIFSLVIVEGGPMWETAAHSEVCARLESHSLTTTGLRMRNGRPAPQNRRGAALETAPAYPIPSR